MSEKKINERLSLKQRRSIINLNDINHLSMKKTQSDPLMASPFFPKDFVEHYTIINLLGKGAQASVYKVQEKVSNKIFAAKLYCTNEKEIINRIKIEVEILKFIDNDKIIAFQKFFEDEENGSFVILTEYFPSIDLKSFILQNTVSLETKQNICKKVLSALNCLHKKSIAHRDFNVNNILINPNTFDIKIIDFGLSQIISEFENFNVLEGNSKFQPPGCFQHSFVLTDLWGAFLIFLSLMLNKPISTKKALKIFEISKENRKMELMLLRNI